MAIKVKEQVGRLLNDIGLLDELKRIAKRKYEIWEEDFIGFGLTWRETPLALEYQKLEDRIWEIKKELFGNAAIEV